MVDERRSALSRRGDLASAEGSEVAAMLSSARRQAGLSQQALARRAGVTREEVSVYERQTRQPSAAVFLRLMASCGQTLAPVAEESAPNPVTREQTLEDVLDLADSLPQRWPGELRYPSFASLGRGRGRGRR